jgi:hypothetical protein
MQVIHDINESWDELSQACISGVLVVTVPWYHTQVSWLQGGATQCHGRNQPEISPEKMEELLASSGEPLTNEELDHNMPFKGTRTLNLP